MKLRWIFTGFAAAVAILAIGFALLSGRARVAPAMAAAPADRALARPAEVAFADRFAGLTFADRFAGAPVWETAYATPARTQTRTIAAAPRPVVQVRTTALDAVRAPAFQLASASATPVGPSEQRAPSEALAYAPSSTPKREIGWR